MSVDKWFIKRYIRNEYTCSDFAREVLLDLTNVDIADSLAGLLQAHDGRGLTRAHVRRFRALKAPVDPCLVVMQRPRAPVHLGVFTRGRILQITQRGVTYLPVNLATVLHTSYRYVQCIS